MTAVTPLTTEPPLVAEKPSRASVAKKRLSSSWASLFAIVIAILWTIPTFGLLISSFRPERAIKRTGWWTFFSDPQVTLDNYRAVFGADGGVNMADFFVNSLVICIPSVLIPLALASLAAYAFAWIDFRGKNFLFIAIFALQIVPLQVALIPLQTIFVGAGLQNSFWPVWIAHTIFGLPLAIFIMHNFMKEIPRSIVEAARVDGAGHVKIFFVVLMPLLVPAIAAFGIFQFLWVWNDLLVALVFASGPETRPLTVRLAELAGTRGNEWQRLTSGAFVSIIIPLIVFLSLQRYFVRGLLAGSVKG